LKPIRINPDRPKFIPRLAKKETYPAFLKKPKTGHFEPAALAMSFHEMKP
jgi:hypothetical protein